MSVLDRCRQAPRSVFILIAVGLTWYIQAAVFVLFGLSFYMLHNNIQVHVTDLSQTARGAALALQSSALFTGQAIGPFYYGFTFGHLGLHSPPLFGIAVVIVIVGLVCARFLRYRRPMPGADRVGCGFQSGRDNAGPKAAPCREPPNLPLLVANMAWGAA